MKTQDVTTHLWDSLRHFLQSTTVLLCKCPVWILVLFCKINVCVCVCACGTEGWFREVWSMNHVGCIPFGWVSALVCSSWANLSLKGELVQFPFIGVELNSGKYSWVESLFKNVSYPAPSSDTLMPPKAVDLHFMYTYNSHVKQGDWKWGNDICRYSYWSHTMMYQSLITFLPFNYSNFSCKTLGSKIS